MALIIPARCVILHVPKCGGTWVRHALENARIWYKYSGPNLEQSCHHTLDDIGKIYLPKVAFIRDPAYWLRSFWAHRDLHGWRFFNDPSHPKELRILDSLETPSFHMFILKYLRNHPGLVSQLFDKYIDETVLVGRQENLVQDLMFALDKYGVKYHKRDIRQTPKKNVTKPPELSTDLLMKIRDVERY